MRTLRVLIADDHPISRSGLEFLLSGEPGLEVVGWAGNGDMAIELTVQLRPDLLVLDLMLPRKPGLVVLEQVRHFDPRPQVIAISGQATGLIFKQAVDGGAEAVLSKEDSSEEILAAVQALRRGHRYRSVTVTRLVGALEPSAGEPALTPREREVLSLVAAGLPNERIAAKLGISLSTAKKHRENIRAKLGISSAVEAARFAVRLGLDPAG